MLKDPIILQCRKLQETSDEIETAAKLVGNPIYPTRTTGTTINPTTGTTINPTRTTGTTINPTGTTGTTNPTTNTTNIITITTAPNQD